MSAARADPELLARITEWIGDGALALADLRYEGEPDICLGERANSLIKTTYKALRRYRGCPWRLGDIVRAALVLLHHENQMLSP